MNPQNPKRKLSRTSRLQATPESRTACQSTIVGPACLSRNVRQQNVGALVMFKSRFRHLRTSSKLFLLLLLIIAIVLAGAAILVFADSSSPVIAGIMAACAFGALIDAWLIGRELR
jgi:hypothetical protein